MYKRQARRGRHLGAGAEPREARAAAEEEGEAGEAGEESDARGGGWEARARGAAACLHMYMCMAREKEKYSRIVYSS